MKVIISHDVDHITPWEHIARDLIIPKFWIRTFLETGLGYISTKELKARVEEMINNKWNYIEELMDFDKSYGIPSTFFIGVANGKGLSYSLDKAAYWIKRIVANGFDVGVHGICYTDPEGIRKEFETFAQIVGHREFGVRMHYLRLNANTLRYLAEAGYIFDSSLYRLDNPFEVDRIWEFPLHIMDSFVFESTNFLHLKNSSFEDAKLKTLKIIEKADKIGIKYLTVLHHDRLFSNAYSEVKKWYEWLVNYLKNEGVEFVSYKSAIEELKVG